MVNMFLFRVSRFFPTNKFSFTKELLLQPMSTAMHHKLIPSGIYSGMYNFLDHNQIILQKSIHTTPIKRDVETGMKAIGGGLATIGVLGPGIGMGLIFGSMLSSMARNPSLQKQLFQYGLMGAALCESIALFALLIAFMNI